MGKICKIYYLASMIQQKSMYQILIWLILMYTYIINEDFNQKAYKIQESNKDISTLFFLSSSIYDYFVNLFIKMATRDDSKHLMSCNSYFKISRIMIITLSLITLISFGNCQCNLYAAAGSYQCQTVGSTNTTFSDNNDYCACNSCAVNSTLDTYKISCCKNNFTANCLTCVGSSTGKCSTCKGGFALNLTSEICKTCGSNCIDCLNLTKCAKCNDYYSLSNGACSLCNVFIAYCSICNSSTTVCFKCDISSYMLANNTCRQCIMDLPYCQSCNSVTACTKCDLYSSLTQSSYCLPCVFFMPYCTQCNSSNTSCLSCSADYYALNQTAIPNLCQYCNATLPYCLSCLNSSYCIKCINDSSIFLKFAGSLSNANSAGGFYTTTKYTGIYGTCLPCNSTYAYCARCNSFVCLSCTVDKHIVLVGGKICSECNMVINYCSTCKNETVCLTCINSFYTTVALNSSNTNCQSCSNLMVGCQTCKNSTVCILCATGITIDGGCSIVPGCIKVIQKGVGNATCMGCNPKQYVSYLVNGVCKCLIGHVAGQYCTQIKGCTVIQIVSGQQVCTSCNVTNNMVVMGGVCGCIAHYQLNLVTQQCSQTCGDGLVFQSQCDDGNKISGDGCSSKCKIQANYLCHGGSPISRSYCTFQSNVSLILVQITRPQNTNSIIIHFQISPSTMLFSQMDINQCLNFVTSQIITVDLIEVNSPDLFLYVAFTDDVVDEMASITINFNQSLIASSPFTFTFPITLTNREQITFKHNLSTIFLYNSIFTYASFLIFLAVLFSSFSEKMIAVQTLHTFQLALFTQVFSSQYEPFFFEFKKLFLTFGQCNFLFKQQKVQLKILAYLQFSSNITANYSIISYIIITLISILAILKVVQCKLQVSRDGSEQRRKKHYHLLINRVQVIIRKLYESLIFPLVVGFYYNFVLSSFLSMFYQQSTSTVYSSSAIMLSSAIYTSIIVLRYFKYFFVSKTKFVDFKKYRIKNVAKVGPQSLEYEPLQSYVSIYLLVMILYGMIMQFSVLFLKFKFVYINFGLIIILIIAQLIFRPYKIILHNVGLIFNQVFICFSCMWVIYEQNTIVSDQIRNVLTAIFISLFSGVVLLSIIRAIYNYRFLYKHLQKNRNKKQEAQENLDNINMRLQLIQNQQQQNLNRYLESTKNVYLQNLRNKNLPMSPHLFQHKYPNSKANEDYTNNNSILAMKQKNRQQFQNSFRNQNSKVDQMKKFYRELFQEKRINPNSASPQQ